MVDLANYLDYSGAPDQLTGGVRRIPVGTPAFRSSACASSTSLPQALRNL